MTNYINKYKRITEDVRRFFLNFWLQNSKSQLLRLQYYPQRRAFGQRNAEITINYASISPRRFASITASAELLTPSFP